VGGVLGRARYLALHVGVDLEQGGKLGVVLAEQVIDQALADQHHLQLQRHRLGLDLDGAGQADQIRQRFDPHFTGPQAALQPFPGVGLGEHLDRVEDEEAAVGPMQRAGADQREVAHQGAHVHHVFDAPDEVLQGRVVFVDHRPAAVGGFSTRRLTR
jgi:hypothetical protein